MAIDPVCNMEVDESLAEHTFEHEGKTHYFCSAGCKTKFEMNPEGFMEGGGMEMPSVGKPEKKPWWKFW